MSGVDLVIFDRGVRAGDPPLTALLHQVRGEIADRQVALFRRVGIERIIRVPGGDRAPAGDRDAPSGRASFGGALAEVLSTSRVRRAVILSSGAVPRLRVSDARRLVGAAAVPGRLALTNNRYSSDVCAVSDAQALWSASPLTNDNALPRWLDEVAGFAVAELPARERLALDLDSPLDIALLALAPACPSFVRRLAGGAAEAWTESGTPPRADRALASLLRAAGLDRLAVPRLAELRALAADPHRELLVFGRSSSRALAWLEGHARCRVRFLAEERGLRAGATGVAGEAAAPGVGAGPAATERAGTRPPERSVTGPARPPRATLGRLLAVDGPEALASRIAEFADGALVDTRVLLADRLGRSEATWPCAEDRFASDLHLAEAIEDPWLQALTQSAASSRPPILLGGHSLVGPGVPLVCRAP